MVMPECFFAGWGVWCGWSFREGGGRGLADVVSHLCQGCSPARGDARLWLLARSPLPSAPHRLLLSIHSFATFFPHPPWSPTLYLPHSTLSLCGNPLPFESWKEGGVGTMGLARHGSDGVSALTEAFHHVFVAVCTPALGSPHSKRSLGVCIAPYRPLAQRPLSALTCTLIFCFYGLMCAYSESCILKAYFLLLKKATINVTEFGCRRTAGTGSRGWSWKRPWKREWPDFNMSHRSFKKLCVMMERTMCPHETQCTLQCHWRLRHLVLCVQRFLP